MGVAVQSLESSLGGSSSLSAGAIFVGRIGSAEVVDGFAEEGGDADELTVLESATPAADEPAVLESAASDPDESADVGSESAGVGDDAVDAGDEAAEVGADMGGAGALDAVVSGGGS